MAQATILGKRRSVSFYLKIPLMTRFSDVFDAAHYRRPPENWYVVVTDVVNSTKAIEAGRYKDVNTSGALAAMAITNYIGNMEFPFVFGGDGMTYLIPDKIVNRVKDILADTRRIVRNILDLELRVGLVPLKKIFDDGYELKIGRLRVSDRYTQAIMDGNGVDYAEKLVKDPHTTQQFQIAFDHSIRHFADLSGFTCRWKPVKSPRGETISLIVKSRATTREEINAINRKVYHKIEEIFGNAKNYRPLRPRNQHVGTTERYLRTEAGILSRHSRGLFYQLRLLRLRVDTMMMNVVRSRLQSTKQSSLINSDFRKFDGTLKMIISCTTHDRIQLQEYLEELCQHTHLFYGIHVSNQALLTCLIQQGKDEVHFVDADGGGYALAAKQLKQQMAAAA